MNAAILFSMIAGACGVLQAGMNRIIAGHLGFTASVFLNGCVFLLLGVLFLFVVSWKPNLVSQSFHLQWAFGEFKWWWVLPGIFGFVLVLGLAFSVSRIGAAQTFVISIAAQIVFSIVWDTLSKSGGQITWLRIVGACLAVAGAFLSSLKSGSP